MERRSAAGWEFSPLPLLVFVVECVPYTRDTGWNRAREDFCEAKTRLKTLFPIPSPFIHLASTIFLRIVIRCCPPECFDRTTINENVSICRSKGLWRYTTPTKATDFLSRLIIEGEILLHPLSNSLHVWKFYLYSFCQSPNFLFLGFSHAQRPFVFFRVLSSVDSSE